MCTVSKFVMCNNTKPTWVSQVMWQITHKGQANKAVGVNKSSCLQSALIEQLPTLEGIHKIGSTIGCSLGCALHLVSGVGKLLCCCICCALKRLLKVIDHLLSILRKLICALLDLISSL